MNASGHGPLWFWTGLGLLAVLGWDALGLDVPLAALAATPAGFAWKDAAFLTALHQGGRILAGVALAWLAIGTVKPLWVLRDLTRSERIWLLGTTLAAMLSISALKRISLSSCPWDLQAFGGMAAYVSHWSWTRGDAGPGHCFPAGHASAAFAFFAGFFVLRERRPRAAAAWLAAVLLTGTVFGLGQQLRGAHYASHTLWTAWLCWAFALISHSVFFRSESDAAAAG